MLITKHLAPLFRKIAHQIGFVGMGEGPNEGQYTFMGPQKEMKKRILELLFPIAVDTDASEYLKKHAAPSLFTLKQCKDIINQLKIFCIEYQLPNEIVGDRFFIASNSPLETWYALWDLFDLHFDIISRVVIH